MISNFLSGDLVKSDRPDRSDLPESESKRIGVVLCHVPAYKRGNTLACSAVQVVWFGPRLGHPSITIEVEHRIAHV